MANRGRQINIEGGEPRPNRRWRADGVSSASILPDAQSVEYVMADAVDALKRAGPIRRHIVGVIIDGVADQWIVDGAADDVLAIRTATAHGPGSSMRSEWPSQANENWQAKGRLRS